jgi:hypothetical protein
MLERAVRVLVRLVRDEWGDERALSEIGFLWGDATDADRQALDELEEGEK